ncbi:MAG: SCP2 sterol-binding domain-containing protein [Rhodobacteraceae bacterium]|nr:SCP2 sterol-binding domain-containing protein [Paracoccaceae bacterium]
MAPKTAPEDFSPLLIVGMMIRPLPVAPLNQILAYVTSRIQHNHPAILDRLRPLTGTDFLIRPTDMPYNIRLTIGECTVDCRIEDEFQAPVDVTISGPLTCLMDMMEGKLDGDALFFSRSLTVEGDTEALLTLRNALDSDDIDLRDEILDLFGPLKGPAHTLLSLGDHLYQNLSRDMSRLGQALTRPLSSRCDGLDQENLSLRDRVGGLEQKLTKTQNRLQALSRKITQ